VSFITRGTKQQVFPQSFFFRNVMYLSLSKTE